MRDYFTASQVTPDGILQLLGGDTWLEIMLEAYDFEELCPWEECEQKQGLTFLVPLGPDHFRSKTRLMFIPRYNGDLQGQKTYSLSVGKYDFNKSNDKRPTDMTPFDRRRFLFISQQSFSWVTICEEELCRIVEECTGKTITFT